MTEPQMTKSAAKRSASLPLSLLMFSLLISAGQPHLGIGGSWAWLLRLISALLFAASVGLALTRNHVTTLSNCTSRGGRARRRAGGGLTEAAGVDLAMPGVPLKAAE